MKFIKYTALILSIHSTNLYAVTDCLNFIERNLEIINKLEVKSEDEPAKLWHLAREMRRGERNALISEAQLALGLPDAERGKVGVLGPQTEEAIKAWQLKNELTATGKLDPITYLKLVTKPVNYQLNVFEDAKKECMNILNKSINEESNRFIEVNIPSSTLRAYEWDSERNEVKLILRSKVIVGATSTPTPLYDFKAFGFKFNPDWTPTMNIIGRNLFDKNKNVKLEWLNKYKIKVYNQELSEIDPLTLTPDNFTKHVYKQFSGPDNALGNLKIETDSQFNIYLHDTNQREYFKENFRAKSSGCIRVDKINDLGQWLFKDVKPKVIKNAEGKGWSTLPVDSFKEYFKKGDSYRMNTNWKVPVYLSYRLVDEDEKGNAQWYPDLYGKKKDLAIRTFDGNIFYPIPN